jgi:hypothetical protein
MKLRKALLVATFAVCGSIPMSGTSVSAEQGAAKEAEGIQGSPSGGSCCQEKGAQAAGGMSCCQKGGEQGEGKSCCENHEGSHGAGHEGSHGEEEAKKGSH